jgi:hypothetical protein
MSKNRLIFARFLRTSYLPYQTPDGVLHLFTPYSSPESSILALLQATQDTIEKKVLFGGNIKVNHAFVPFVLKALEMTRPTFSSSATLLPSAKHPEICAHIDIQATELQFADQIHFADSMANHFPVFNQDLPKIEEFLTNMQRDYARLEHQNGSLQRLLDLVHEDDETGPGLERILNGLVPRWRSCISDLSTDSDAISSPAQPQEQVAGPSRLPVLFPSLHPSPDAGSEPEPWSPSPEHGKGLQQQDTSRSQSTPTPICRPKCPPLVSQSGHGSSSSDSNPMRSRPVFANTVHYSAPSTPNASFGQIQRQLTYSEPSPSDRHSSARH